MQWKAFIRRLFKKRQNGEIYPDEIFIDATNLPQFNSSQFEGRIERPLSKRTFFYFGSVVLMIVLVFSGRVFYLQVAQGEAYAAESENNRLDHSIIFSDRGVIYDRTGAQLVWNEAGEGEDFSKRVYQSKKGLAHVLGHIGYPLRDTNGNYYQTEFVGKSGVEALLNDPLNGENGLKIVETDALQVVRSESVIRPPTDGKNFTLTVDQRVTEELYRLIEERSTESGFEGGAGVIMDVHSGELLALTSFPEYNPNILSEGNLETVQKYISDTQKPFLNRVVSGLYTPGSIVKPFIALAALEEGIITPEKKILSTGALTLPNPYFPDKPSVFRDWKAHGLVNMREAIAVSSDVYFYEIGGGYEEQKGLGIVKIDEYMRLFGFGNTTGIRLEAEASGTIPNPEWKALHFEGEPWRVGNTYHTAIGQYGSQVTPLQAVRAVAALANGGKLLKPQLVVNEKPVYQSLSLDPKNVDVVREGMRLAVTAGTAQGLSKPEVSVAAKTGTAELGAEKKFVNSWIVGFFPYEEPRYAFAVLMERGPEENLVGGLYVMRRLLDWMVEHTPEYLSG